MTRHKREELEAAEAELARSMQRLRKVSSDHKELVRSLVPPEEREEDTSKFRVPPLPPVPAEG